MAEISPLSKNDESKEQHRQNQTLSPELMEKLVHKALIWCSLHGLVVGDKHNQHEKACIDNQHVFIPFSFDTFGFLAPDAVQFLKRVQRVMHSNVMSPRSMDVVFKRIGFAIQKGLAAQLVARLPSISISGKVPGVGIVHAPFALLPSPLARNQFLQACELTPIFNELVDRLSLDSKFLQDSLSRTKKVDAFTSRLLDIHSKMLETGKKEDVRLGLHRSDYMLDAQSKDLLQIELNTISCSFPGLGCLVSELHRTLLNQYGENLKMDSTRIPKNMAANRFADALAKAWKECNDSRAVIMFVVQPEERNMYDQLWLCSILQEEYGVQTIQKTLLDISTEGSLQPDETLLINNQLVGVIYFRAGYTPNDYPSESEWDARLLMEQSTAIKCPSISYHLVGTKKIQQELAKPNVLERFLDDKDDIAKLRKCFAGLWSLDDTKIMEDVMEHPELFVLKPQREGGGNNIYGEDVKETLIKLQKESSEELAAYILMQRIFPTALPSFLVINGLVHQDNAISELGIYVANLRNKDNVVINEQCGYLTRTKASSSNEGGVVAGFGVLDSVYLT